MKNTLILRVSQGLIPKDDLENFFDEEEEQDDDDDDDDWGNDTALNCIG